MNVIQAADGTWQVVDAIGQVIVADMSSREAAVAALGEQVAGVLAGLPEGGIAAGRGARFHMSFVEGELSVDGRVIDPGATQFDRPPPLPVMLMTANEGGGHMGARLSGVIDQQTRTGSVVHLYGNFDAGSEAGQEHERLVREGVLTTWSPDFSSDSDVTIEGAEEEILMGEGGVMHLTRGTIIGGTGCPFPALTSARIEALAAGGFPVADVGRIEIVDESLASSGLSLDVTRALEAVDKVESALQADGAPARPPAAWFNDPGLPCPTPLTITNEGRVMGHAAQWGVCHTSFLDECVLAPHSAHDYAFFLTGTIETAEGELRRVGQLTMGCGHADTDPRITAAAAKAHYDGGPGACAFADVTMGEDEHGVWFSGALRPGITDEQRRVALSQALSGDWRPLDGALELVAVLSVPVPGFPILASAAPRPTVRLSAGKVVAMVAAGALAPRSPCGCDDQADLATLQRELAELRALVDARTVPLRASAAERLMSRLRGV